MVFEFIWNLIRGVLVYFITNTANVKVLKSLRPVLDIDDLVQAADFAKLYTDFLEHHDLVIHLEPSKKLLDLSQLANAQFLWYLEAPVNPMLSLFRVLPKNMALVKTSKINAFYRQFVPMDDDEMLECHFRRLLQAAPIIREKLQFGSEDSHYQNVGTFLKLLFRTFWNLLRDLKANDHQKAMMVSEALQDLLDTDPKFFLAPYEIVNMFLFFQELTNRDGVFRNLKLRTCFAKINADFKLKYFS